MAEAGNLSLLFLDDAAFHIATTLEPDTGLLVKAVMYAISLNPQRLFLTGSFGHMAAQRWTDGSLGFTHFARDDGITQHFHLDKRGHLTAAISGFHNGRHSEPQALDVTDRGARFAMQLGDRILNSFDTADRLSPQAAIAERPAPKRPRPSRDPA